MRTRLLHFARDNWLFLLVVGAIAVAFFALRTSPTPLQSMDEVQAILEDGQPTLVEFYTNT
ncbi:MAG: hypothetical protein PVF47_10530 [Anaerolineae bacterium]|jgi:hypothetical protein